jgi:hypothetical protein
MNHPGPLGDRLALAILADGPTSGAQLARRVKARKGDVLHELRSRPRFERRGRGRASRWSFSAWDRRGTDFPGRGRNVLLSVGLDPSGIPLAGRGPEKP